MPFFRGDEKAASYVPPVASPSQMKAFERAIVYSQDATDLAKKIIIWVLRQTNNLTKQVALSLPEEFCGWSIKEMQDGAHDMVSVNGATHFDLLSYAMGTKMHLQHHCGAFVGNSGVFDSEISGRTIYFAYVWYPRDVELLRGPTVEEIDAIDLEAIKSFSSF